jgi:hypothetical protein
MILPWAAKHSSISPPTLSNSSSVPEYDRFRNSRFQVTIPVAGSPTSAATLISSVRQVHGSPSPQRVVAAVGGAFGLVGKEPIGCPDPSASGQELWKGTRKTQRVTKWLAPEAVGGRWPG